MVQGIKYKVQIYILEKCHPKMAYVLRFSLGFESFVSFEPYVRMLRNILGRAVLLRQKWKLKVTITHKACVSADHLVSNLLSLKLMDVLHATESTRVLAKNNLDLTSQALSCLERTHIEYCKGLCSYPCNTRSLCWHICIALSQKIRWI